MPQITTTVDRGSARNVQINDLFLNTTVIGEIPEGVINTTQPTLRVTAEIDSGTSILDRPQRTTIKAINTLVAKVQGRASVTVAVASATSNYTSVTVASTAVSPISLLYNGVAQDVSWVGGDAALADALATWASQVGLVRYTSDSAARSIGLVSQDSTSPFTLSSPSAGVTIGNESGGTSVTALDYIKCINRLTALDVGDLPVGFLILPSAYTKFRASDCHLITAAALELAAKHHMVLLVDAPNPDIALQAGVNTGAIYTAPPNHAVGSLFYFGGTVYRVVTALAVTTASNGATYPTNALVYLPSNGNTYRSLTPSATFADIANPDGAELLTFALESPKSLIQRWLNLGGIVITDRGYNTPSAYADYASAVPKGLDGQAMIYLQYWDDGTGNFYPYSSIAASEFIATWVSRGFLVNHAGNQYPVPKIVGLSYTPKDADLAAAKYYNYVGARGNFHTAGVRTNALDDKFRWITGSIAVAMTRRQCQVAASTIQYQPLQGINALISGVSGVFNNVLERLKSLYFNGEYRVIADLSNNTEESLQSGTINVKICVRLVPDLDEVFITVAVKAINENLE